MKLISLFLAIFLHTYASAKVKYNSQQLLPENTLLIDIDGDGMDEAIQYNQNRLFIFKMDLIGSGVTHLYERYNANIKDVFVGKFYYQSKNSVCIRLHKVNIIKCFSGFLDRSVSPYEKIKLVWQFSSFDSIKPEEQIFVGDFNGDQLDDLMLYTARTGEIRFLSKYSTGFGPMGTARSNPLTLGNLKTHQGQLKNKKIIVGRFRNEPESRGRDDIVFFDPLTKEVHLFVAKNVNGSGTFHWAFTSLPVIESLASTQVLAAEVTGDEKEEIIVKNLRTGEISTFDSIVLPDLSLKPLRNINYGPVLNDPSYKMAFGKFSNYPSESFSTRDDILVYFSTHELNRYDARLNSDSDSPTYNWKYTKVFPIVHKDWPISVNKKLWVVKCGLIDDTSVVGSAPSTYQTGVAPQVNFGSTTKPYASVMFKADPNLGLTTGMGQGGMYEYLREATFNNIDIGDSEIKPTPDTWYNLTYSSGNIRYGVNTTRSQRISECMAKAGARPAGFTAGIAITDKAVDYGGVGINSLFDPTCYNNLTCAAHEALHALGTSHSFAMTWDQNGNRMDPSTPNQGANEYGDITDVMSAWNVESFSSQNFGQSGPLLNLGKVSDVTNDNLVGAYSKTLPPYKIETFDVSSNKSGTTRSYNLAALDSPETVAPLSIRVKPVNKNYQYSIEFRVPRGFDRSLNRGLGLGGNISSVFIYRLHPSCYQYRRNNSSIERNDCVVLERASNANNTHIFRQGSSYRIDGVTISVDRIDPVNSISTISITKD